MVSLDQVFTGIFAAVSAILGWFVKRLVAETDKKFAEVDEHLENTDRQVSKLVTKVAVLESQRHYKTKET